MAWSETAISYFTKRAIDPQIAEEFGVVESAAGLSFPHPCVERKQFARTRSLNSAGAKVRQPPGTSLCPWRPTTHRGPLVEALVCEGESDALAALTALRGSPVGHLGALPVVGIPGTGFPVKRMVEFLIDARVRHAWLALDADDAGRSYTARLVEELSTTKLRVSVVELPDGSDLADSLAAVREDERGDWIANALVNAEAAALDAAVEAEEEQAPEHGRLAIVNAAEVEPVVIGWTWHKRIPDEAVTLLVGREGTGKSTFSAHLTANATRGRLAGHLHGRDADVIVATLEDPAASVAVPRLIAAGADLGRVHFLQLGGDQTEPLAIPDDLAAIEAAVGKVDARLLIVDPLVATLPEKINGHRDQHVRRALAPLADMAERMGLAAVVVIHFNKAPGSDALLRVGGSIAFVAAARSVLAFGYDPEDPEGEQGNRRVLAHPKSNFGPKQKAIRYKVEEHDFDHNGETISTSRLAFVEECDITAGEFFVSRDPDERSREDEARDWLIGHLADGEWHLSADVKEEGERKRHRPRTLQRAVHRMADDGEAEVSKEGFPARSYWRLSSRARGVGATGVGATAKSPANPLTERETITGPLQSRQTNLLGATEANGASDDARYEAEIERLGCRCRTPARSPRANGPDFCRTCMQPIWGTA